LAVRSSFQVEMKINLKEAKDTGGFSHDFYDDLEFA